MKTKTIAAAVVAACLLPAIAPSPSHAAAPIMASAPAGKTIQDYYKQSVYDPANNKIGSVEDVVVNDSGRLINPMIVEGQLVIPERDAGGKTDVSRQRVGGLEIEQRGEIDAANPKVDAGGGH